MRRRVIQCCLLLLALAVRADSVASCPSGNPLNLSGMLCSSAGLGPPRTFFADYHAAQALPSGCTLGTNCNARLTESDPGTYNTGSGFTTSTNNDFALMKLGSNITINSAASLPSAAPNNVDSAVTLNSYSGTIGAGAWTFRVISNAGTYTGTWQASVRVWLFASQNCTSATEITSGAVLSSPATGGSAVASGTFTTSSASTLSTSFICLQVAVKQTAIDTGNTLILGGAATVAVLITPASALSSP